MENWEEVQDVIIERVVSKNQQDVNYRECISHGGIMFLVDIRSNAHIFEGHAKIEKWDGHKWELVFAIPTGDMDTPAGLCLMRKTPFRHPLPEFVEDRNRLVRAAYVINHLMPSDKVGLLDQWVLTREGHDKSLVSAEIEAIILD